MKYKVYNKNGEQKDALMVFSADSLERAIIFASQIKKLTPEKFLEIFVVKKV